MKRSRGAATSARTRAAAPAAGTRLSAGGAFVLNACFVAGLLLLSQLSLLQQRPTVRVSIVFAALFLLAWSGLLFGVLRRGQDVALEIVARRQHYLQACQQGAVILYWGYYWREVYHAAPLIAAQLLFAYGFDSLLSWTHRRKFVLGFGPFPIIFSINLFLWFKDDWFYLQFAMVALGFLAKEFLRWTRDEVNTHIFNPSSFPLAVASALLLITNASQITWGADVAQTQFFPPQMYLAIFLFAMPGQYLFGVTSMTMSAVVTTFVFSAVYYAATGAYFFSDSHVPIAVFLGMHLLFTDPATSPRTELGRIVYGVLYGASTVLLYSVLIRAGMPGFYDKLLQVPLLNLSAKLLDRLAPALRSLARAVAAAPENRSLGVGTGAGPAPEAPGLHQRVGGCLRRHERVRVPGRQTSRAILAVLAEGVRGRRAQRLRGSVLSAGRLLRGRFRMGVQRARRSIDRALRQSPPGGDGVRARVRAAVLRRLRQHVRPRAGRHVPARRADGCRLPVHPAR